jgi:HPt (histidine-containing phosphotransfer) domain-containing protein
MDQNAIRQHLDRLRATFTAELPARLTEADRLLAALQNGDGDAAEALRMIVHRLHGTGGTMGFAALSEAAAALEALLDDGIRAGQAGAAALPEIAAGLQRLKDAAALA